MPTKSQTPARRLADSVILTLLHRFSPYIISVMLSVIAWFGTQKLNDVAETNAEIKETLEQIELRNLKQDSEIQDHESRMVFGKTARESFQADALRQFDKLNDRLDAVGARLTDINGSLIELQTTIKERVPERRAALRDAP